jgi:UDP-glucuronate decarboxylase
MKYTDGYLCGLKDCARRNGAMELAGSKILITGASGLIGSALADVLLCSNRDLDNSIEVILAGRNEEPVTRRFSYWGNSAYAFAKYDAAEPVCFDFEADYVIHCASNAHPRAYTEQPVETLVNNVAGTSNMLAYARDCGARRVLYVSSSEVYGKRSGMQPYGEDEYYLVDPLNARSCYPNSKRACETLCVAYFYEYGLDSVIARPGHVWGPTATGSDSRAHAEFARNAAAKRDIVLKSPGGQLRSYIYSTDCAGALLTILLKGASREAYNVGVPGEACTIRQLADALALAGGVDVVRDFPTADEKRGYNPMSCSALDCGKLANLGFKAQWCLEDAARETVDCLVLG